MYLHVRRKELGAKISVIGAGSMGTAISIILSKNGNTLDMGPFTDKQDDKYIKEHIHKLPGVLVPEGVYCIRLGEMYQWF